MPAKMKPARMSRAVSAVIESLEGRCLFSALSPSASVLVFNASTSGGQPSHTDTLTLTNTGSSALALSGVSVVADPGAGSDLSADFHVTNGPLPSTLAAGASTQVTINFTASVANTVEAALLEVAGGGSTLATVQLHGLGTNGQFGYAEPSLANILTAFDIPTNIGVSDPSNSQYPESPGASSQEVPLERLVKAGSGPVTIQMLAGFNAAATPSVRFGYYSPGDSTATTELFTINQADDQTVNPVAQGATSFDPGSNEFGLYATFPGISTGNGQPDTHYSEDSLNTLDATYPRKFRFFPLENNADGSTVPNAYVVAAEDYNSSTYNSFTNFVAIIRNVQAAPGAPHGAVLGLTNPDAVPGSDTLVFNRIQNPQPTDPNNFVDPVHDTNTLVVSNTGDQPLSITALTLSDTTNWAIANPPALPATVAPGGTMNITIRFIATTDPAHAVNETNDYNTVNGISTTAAGGVWNGTLTISSNDAARPTRSVPLAGYWQYESENENEPGLQTIINSLYGFGTLIAADQQPNYQNYGTQAIGFGEEDMSAYWNAADTSLPVTITQLAAYHNQFDANNNLTATSLFYYPQGNPGSLSLLFKNQTGQSQTLFPTISGSNTALSQASFTPGGNFGWNIDGEASDNSLNTTDINTYGRSGHAIRFYPVHDSQGNLVANTWIMAMDYQNGQYDNYDYQDNLYIVSNMRPASAPAAPSDLQAIAAASGVTIEWSPVPDGSLIGYNVYRATSLQGQNPYTQLNSAYITGDSFVDTTAVPGQTYYYGVASINSSGQSRGITTMVQTAAASSQTWASADINASPTGSTAVANGTTYQVTGGGLDIGGSNLDGFRYVYEQFTGNFDVSTQIPSITQSGASNAKAGIMARQSLDPSTAMVFAGVTPGQGYRFNYRTSQYATGVYNSSGSITFPDAYVRLVRQGDVFTSYSSPDGTTWTEMGSVTLNLSSSIYLGVAVSAESSTQTIEADFVGFPPVVVSPPPPPPSTTVTAPTGLTANTTSSAVTLQWTAESAAAGYNVLRSTSSSSGFAQLNSSELTSPSYVDSAVTQGTTYYYEVVAVDGSGGVSSPATASATVPTTSKTLAFGGRKTVTYTDDQGHPVVLRITGPGSGQATFVNGQLTPDSIALTGTTSGSTFSITVVGGTTHVGSITDDGSLGHVTASKTVLAGNLSVAGSLGSVSLAGATGGSDTITARAISRLTVNGNFAASLNLTGGGNELNVATIKGALTGGPWTLAGSAGQWVVGSVDSSWSATVASTLGSFNSRGNFAGSLTAGTIGNMHVGGAMTGTVHLTAGTANDLRVLSVAGAVNGGQILAAGGLGSVSAGSLAGANIFAGVSPSVSTLPSSAGQFVNDSTIASVTITGRGLPFAVSGSNIAAQSLGRINLGAVNPNNGGLPFGLAAHSLLSFTQRINGKIVTWTSRMDPSLLTANGDEVVRLL